ncbi:MAG: putative molybdenum carrier protein [Verrucomicrobiota bacterium]
MTVGRNAFEKVTIFSGGQTGVDRAALEFALEADIPHGGWCPHGRAAEDGSISPKFQLRETESADPAVRSRLNVLDTDATLIFSNAEVECPGTKLTRWFATILRRPLLVFDKAESSCDAEFAGTLQRWLLDDQQPRLLNVAGPRASADPDIRDFSLRVLRACQRDDG